MATMDRRDFLLAALGGLGGLGLAACSDTPGLLLSPDGTFSADLDAATGVHIRRNIYCLSESSPDLIAYRAGVAAMKARPASDPTSWEAQRAIHWTFGIPPTAIYNQCHHGTAFFLSWHRMYLYYFERIVRAASGNPNFALPYWGYSPTGLRYLPVPFRVPADATNTLYTASRNGTINAGADLPTSSVDPTVALAELAFYDFQDELEVTPHNVVHGNVGGWMGSVPTAALDPIFYLHHAQIDRLWAVWLAQGGGRTNPTDSPWLNNSYKFYNEYGSVVSLTGAQIVDTVNQLCYRYASPVCKVAVPIAEPVEPAQMEAAALSVSGATAALRSSPIPVAEAQVGVKLGGTPVTVAVTIPKETRDALRAEEAGGNLRLLLQGIVLERAPRVYYEVYVNLPDAADTVYTSPHYAGNLGFFNLTMPAGAHGAHAEHVRRLRLRRVYAYLRSRGEWSDEQVRVTFVPRGPTEADDAAKVMPGTQATIGRITLELR